MFISHCFFLYFKANWVVPEEQSAGPRLHASPQDQNEVTGFPLIKKRGRVSKRCQWCMTLCFKHTAVTICRMMFCSFPTFLKILYTVKNVHVSFAILCTEKSKKKKTNLWQVEQREL